MFLKSLFLPLPTCSDCLVVGILGKPRQMTGPAGGEMMVIPMCAGMARSAHCQGSCALTFTHLLLVVTAPLVQVSLALVGSIGQKRWLRIHFQGETCQQHDRTSRTRGTSQPGLTWMSPCCQKGHTPASKFRCTLLHTQFANQAGITLHGHNPITRPHPQIPSACAESGFSLFKAGASF